MTLSFIRCLFIILCGVVGYYVGTLMNQPMFITQIGVLSGLVLIFLETRLRRVSVRGLSSLVFGLLLGLFMAKMLSNILRLLPLGDFTLSVSEIVLMLIFSYLGAVMALRGKDEFNIIIPYVRFKRIEVHERVVLLDTSAIIDGRVAEIYKTNFLCGRLVVPRSVLQELQKLSDSDMDLKRQKGRRGIELLRNMQKDEDIDVHVHEDDAGENEPVDNKLMELAKLMDASLCTTDFNLGRVATAQGIEVLNINNLINAVKAEVFAGDKLDVKLIKEGKEQDQGVGYLEDGTMIVVSGAKNHIGEKVNVMVSSVLQTQAGKMIFAKLLGVDSPEG